MIQRAKAAPRRGFEPPHELSHGLALFVAAAAARAIAALLAAQPAPGLAIPPWAPPLAPWLVSLGLSATRGHPWTGASVAISAGALAAPAAAQFASGLYGPTAGRAAGWSVALAPVLLAGALMLDANVFALAMLAALTAGAAWLRTPRRSSAFGAGMLCGIASLAATTGLLLAPLLLAWGWRPLGLTVRSRERILQTTLLLMGAGVVLMPWLVPVVMVKQPWAPGQLFALLASLVPQWPPHAAARFAGMWGLHPLTLALAEAAWLLFAAWGVLRAMSGQRRWYQSLPFIALVVLMLSGLTGNEPFRARLAFEPLLALLAGFGALSAQRSVQLSLRGMRVVREVRRDPD